MESEKKENSEDKEEIKKEHLDKIAKNTEDLHDVLFDLFFDKSFKGETNIKKD